MSEHAHVDGVYSFPAVMQTQTIETNGTSIHVRVGGHGPAVVMLHGFGTTGDMWGDLASALIEDHMIVAPDLRGLGLSSKPDFDTCRCPGYASCKRNGDFARRRYQLCSD